MGRMEDPTFDTPVHKVHFEIAFEIAIYELWHKGCGITDLENKQNGGQWVDLSNTAKRTNLNQALKLNRCNVTYLRLYCITHYTCG